MEIPITQELKKLDSGLIRHLISILNEPDKTIIINKQYSDVYAIIKKDKTIYVDFKDINKVNHIVEGLAYFGNTKIFENLLKKLSHYIKQKYRKENKYIYKYQKEYEDYFNFVYEDEIKNNNLYCVNTNLSEGFYEKYIFICLKIGKEITAYLVPGWISGTYSGY